MVDWNKEISRIRELCLEGKTLQSIADSYGVSKARMGQIVQKFFPDLPSEQRGASLIVAKKREEVLERRYAKTGRYAGQHETDLSRAMSQCFIRKKQNSKSSKWKWEITPLDVEFPLICPILGLELDWFAEYRNDNSPSFDRVDNSKGYIPGNVIICSWRANRIKNDGTAEEHRRIADFLDKYNTDIIARQAEV